MDKNFTVIDSVAVQFEDHYLDLHNSYDLYTVSVNLELRQLTVSFSVTDKNYSFNNPENITILFDQYNYLDISSLSGFVQDIAEVGYKTQSDFNHDWLVPETKHQTSDHLFFRLAKDEYIRVHAKIAILLIEGRS